MQNRNVGKVRRLQQIAGEDGIFAMCAMDHRDSMKKMLQDAGASAGYRDMVERKVELCSVLAPHASAVLLDPQYGVAECIAAGVLPGRTGLLVSIEDTGYLGGKESRTTTLLKDWSVEKTSRMGASAVKILLYYRPDLHELARRQQDLVRRVADDCARLDMPFLVETKAYPVGAEVGDPALFARNLPRIVVDTAAEITGLPVDVLKCEFPADVAYEKDEARMLALCRELDRASRVPWVLLSAGVDYDTFRRQVEMACRAGASGFLGGRAIWQEAFAMGDKAKRMEYLSTVVVERLKELRRVASRNGAPWYGKLGLGPHRQSEVVEGWYERY